ncbi:MAG TPA: NB-ARC domain-containing protein, partial [Propionibacteriaceae bacterium]|nr:NB-ARC domain-containing protein [Propionibacteriaceae bacterium]
SDVFIGIYGQQYGWIAPDQEVSGLEDEYLNAGGMPKLVYVQSPAPDRDPRLKEMLSRIQSDGLSYRGFATSEELSTLIADDLAVLLSERFDLGDEPKELERPSRPLPSPASRFIGREREKSLVRDLLTGGDTRLVTLVGPGGIGKTRLALEVGSGLVGRFDGVVMVALEGVSSADLVVSSIASSLSVAESPGQSLLDLVINYLRPRKMLLIIDNFEQVVAAAGVLGQLITQTDQVSMLVTSRERLHLSGERVVEVPPLQVPEVMDHADVLRRSDAVELFIDRARAAGSEQDLDHDQLETIAEICRRLDGIPLAIELAASRAKVVGPEELLRRLDRRLSFLTGGPRDLPLRQQTLRSTIAWSHDLLDDSERRLFARLGVFAAGFSLEAAETVCADDAVPTVLDGIASLVDKSLLQTEDPLHGQPRFTMLQVVRDFALEQLDALGETEQLRRAHADYYQRVIIAAEPMLRRDPRPVIEQYRADLPNIRATLRWSLEVKEGGRVARIAIAIWPFLWIAGLLSESVEVVQQALVDESALSDAERAHARLGLGMLAFGQGDYNRAAPALETAIDLYTQLGDVGHVATALVPLGVIRAVWDPNGGEDLLAQAVDTFRELDDQWGLAFASLNLGGALLQHHRYADAIPHLEEALEHARAVKAEVFLSNALINLGWVYHWLGDLEAARAQLREAVEHAAVPDNRESLGRAFEALAAVDVAAGHPELAATLFGAADGVRRSIGAGVWMTDRGSHEQTEAQLRTQLGDTAYTAAADSGRNLTVDQVLELISAG